MPLGGLHLSTIAPRPEKIKAGTACSSEPPVKRMRMHECMAAAVPRLQSQRGPASRRNAAAHGARGGRERLTRGIRHPEEVRDAVGAGPAKLAARDPD